MITGLPAPYPIAWPPDRLRIARQNREPDRYGVNTTNAAIDTVDAEVKRWRGQTRAVRLTSWELTTNLSVRTKGDPDDPAAALWFILAGKDITTGQQLMVLACDRFRKLAQNIRAISLTMERLRLVDDIGAYSLVAAVEGAKALPPPDKVIDWREVLGLGPSPTLTMANGVYRALAAEAGEGSHRLKELNAAIAAARAELK